MSVVGVCARSHRGFLSAIEGQGTAMSRSLLLFATLAAYCAAFNIGTTTRSFGLKMAAPVDDSIQASMKTRMKLAMKKGPDGKAELGAVRLINAALTTKQKEDGMDELPDDMAITVLKKLAKMRKESIEMYEKAGAGDKADDEKFELALIEEYLPAMAGEADVRGWIAEAIAAECPDGPDKSKMGKVMGALNKAHGGEFDNKDASGWVKEMLSA